jgi:hypothetical protein
MGLPSEKISEFSGHSGRTCQRGISVALAMLELSVCLNTPVIVSAW